MISLEKERECCIRTLTRISPDYTMSPDYTISLNQALIYSILSHGDLRRLIFALMPNLLYAYKRKHHTAEEGGKIHTHSHRKKREKDTEKSDGKREREKIHRENLTHTREESEEFEGFPRGRDNPPSFLVRLYSVAFSSRRALPSTPVSPPLFAEDLLCLVFYSESPLFVAGSLRRFPPFPSSLLNLRFRTHRAPSPVPSTSIDQLLPALSLPCSRPPAWSSPRPPLLLSRRSPGASKPFAAPKLLICCIFFFVCLNFLAAFPLAWV